MSIKLGPPVEGKHFIGRKKIIKKIINMMSEGLHILLSAPRRVGKTSIARRVLYLLRKEGWDGVYVSVEGAGNEVIFAQRIIDELKKRKSLWSKIKGGFTDTFKSSNIELEAFGAKIKYRNSPNEVMILLETLGKSIQNIKGNFLIVIDELPVFLAHLEKEEDGKKRVESVLNTLRSFRQQEVDESYEKTNITAWMFCGSISLESFANQRNLAYTINDVRALKIGAYDTDEAKEYLDTVSGRERMNLTGEVRDYIIDKTGWPIPFYLGIILEEAIESSNQKDLSLANVDAGYEIALKAHKKDFDQWIQRLKLHINQFEIYLHVLKLIARHNAVDLDMIKSSLLGTEWESIQELKLLAILDLLETDGYTVLENKEYQYRSPIIRDYVINQFHLS